MNWLIGRVGELLRVSLLKRRSRSLFRYEALAYMLTNLTRSSSSMSFFCCRSRLFSIVLI